jgi:hypothetical protein
MTIRHGTEEPIRQHAVVRNPARDITQSNTYDRRKVWELVFRGKKKCIVALAVGKETTRVHDEGSG